ncbi:MAG: ATP-binding protein [Gammaproteobacteria bacterium]|nr:ATP-binding protein [Gammaproteobacteria bacterium]
MATQPQAGRLRIGDDWNAISIIALAQSNPLKAVAELVENCIDAGAKHVTLVRGREQGQPFLSVIDDGEGIRKDADGAPDFRYVATHICDSFKRRLKGEEAAGIQGEFGIGLLSFWTLGESLFMRSGASDGVTYQMRMDRNHQQYTVSRSRTLIPIQGTELKVRPLLPGIRKLSGDKLQWYLAAELRDRIRTSGVQIRIVDRQARKEYRVVPRQFDGERIHDLPSLVTPLGEIFVEIYLADERQGNVGLYRAGTRVLESFSNLDDFTQSVWTTGELEGIVDAPFLNLTPGTRSGVIRDAAFRLFVDAIATLADPLQVLIEERRRAEEERASEKMLKSIQRAFREALTALAAEDYDWFDISRSAETQRARAIPGQDSPAAIDTDPSDEFEPGVPVPAGHHDEQRDFFEFPGPLHSTRISPISSILRVGESRTLRAICRDRSGRAVIRDVRYHWSVLEAEGALDAADGEVVAVTAPDEPGLMQLRLVATQHDVQCEADAQITVTNELLETRGRTTQSGRGLPGYTFEHAPGGLWRSRFDADRNLIIVNNGHRDFVFAAKVNAVKLRYIARLYAKELVLKNFPGAPAAEVAERMIEVTLYMESHLR